MLPLNLDVWPVTPDQIAGLQRASALAWVALNGFQNENQKKLEFKNHRFMIDLYADDSPDIVCIKSAQVGFSVYAILKSFHELKYEKRNILYALPTRNVVQDFVVPKVNPLISSNPLIAKEMGSDSVSLKKLGDRFIYFKGGSEREAISVSTDTLVIDEYDRMPDMSVVTMFDSRLQAAVEPRRRRFSNPSSVGFGIDALWRDSNQFHWFVKCKSCNHEMYIDYNHENNAHYVNKERQVFACGKCDGEITDSDRRNGRWIAKYHTRPRHGYWISQMMAPWVTAKRIIEQSEEMDIATFHSMVLGKAYTPSDLIVNRETILRANAPGLIPRIGVAMGVDQKASELEWVAGTSQGIFAHGKAKSWEEIEQMKLTWNAVLVCDPAPYPTQPKIYASKYRDWYMCYFKETNDLSILEWKDKRVFVDRTRGLDIVAGEITDAKLLFREHPNMLEDYIADWQNIYRTTVEQPDGRTKSTWLKKDNKESDYPFATLYFRLALSKVIDKGNAMMFEEQLDDRVKYTDAIAEDGRYHTTVTTSVKDTFADMD